MQFNLRTRPIHCRIWTLTIDMLAPQIFRAYLEFAWHTNPYCPPELRICTPDIFKVCTSKFYCVQIWWPISNWIYGYCIWIPIFEHYNCIANSFARCSHSAASVMQEPFASKGILFKNTCQIGRFKYQLPLDLFSHLWFACDSPSP